MFQVPRAAAPVYPGTDQVPRIESSLATDMDSDPLSVSGGVESLVWIRAS